jgi:fumarate reductase flavoprotein subunit
MSTKVMDCDLVVIGAGGAGMVAAVKAFDLTGAKVIVLEKSRKPGGATYLAGGMGESGPIKDSKWQKEAGWEVSEPQDISGQFFDWLVTKGDAETFFSIEKRQEGDSGSGSITMPKRTEKYKDLPDPSIGPGKMGSWVVDKLVDCCKKQGITLLTATPARRFITDASGKVTGVLADSPDGQILINCKAVVMAAGGYGSSQEKLKKYYPRIFNNTKIHSLCPPYAHGDCMDMFESVGGYVDPTIRSTSFPGGFYGNGAMHHPYTFAVGRFNSGLSVNLLGKRVLVTMGGDDLGIGSQPGGVTYSILDSDMVESIGKQMESGQMGGPGGSPGGASTKKVVPGFGPANATESPETKAMKKWRESLEYEIAIDEAGAAGNHAKRADTLVELAIKMRVDPKALVETVEEYNKSIAKGGGASAGGGGPMGMGGASKPIVKGPFYAVFGHRWSQCTKGRNGVAVNSKFQGLNPKGEVMPGLYAAGDGCTIFGGLTLNKNSGGPGMNNFGVTKGVSATSVAGMTAPTSTVAPGGAPAGGGAPTGGGAPAGGGAPTGGAPTSGQSAQGDHGGGMPGMVQAIDFKTDEGKPCGGLGPAFLSGYYVGLYVGEYLKSV